jgi:hypothetical protein
MRETAAVHLQRNKALRTGVPSRLSLDTADQTPETLEPRETVFREAQEGRWAIVLQKFNR